MGNLFGKLQLFSIVEYFPLIRFANPVTIFGGLDPLMNTDLDFSPGNTLCPPCTNKASNHLPR